MCISVHSPSQHFLQSSNHLGHLLKSGKRFGQITYSQLQMAARLAHNNCTLHVSSLSLHLSSWVREPAVLPLTLCQPIFRALTFDLWKWWLTTGCNAQRMATPKSSILRAATRDTIPYMAYHITKYTTKISAKITGLIVVLIAVCMVTSPQAIFGWPQVVILVAAVSTTHSEVATPWEWTVTPPRPQHTSQGMSGLLLPFQDKLNTGIITIIPSSPQPKRK